MGEKQEGWSFEADDFDVSKLIEETRQEFMSIAEITSKDEKTPLEDIFKFDAELVAATNFDPDEDEDDKSSNAGTTAEESESDAQYPSSKQPQIMALSMREYPHSQNKDADCLSKSLVCGGSTSAESSSVGNSPNPKNVKKNRSKKKGGKRK